MLHTSGTLVLLGSARNGYPGSGTGTRSITGYTGQYPGTRCTDFWPRYCYRLQQRQSRDSSAQYDNLQQSEQAQVLNYRSPKKEPERRSGRQKRNLNGVPVRSGSTGALLVTANYLI